MNNQAVSRYRNAKIHPELHAILKAESDRTKRDFQAILEEVIRTGMKIKRLLPSEQAAA